MSIQISKKSLVNLCKELTRAQDDLLKAGEAVAAARDAPFDSDVMGVVVRFIEANEEVEFLIKDIVCAPATDDAGKVAKATAAMSLFDAPDGNAENDKKLTGTLIAWSLIKDIIQSERQPPLSNVA